MMPRLTITNLTNSPFDLEGGVYLPAMDSVTGEFSEHYAALLRASPGVDARPADPLDHDGDGNPGGSLAGDDSTVARGRKKRAA